MMKAIVFPITLGRPMSVDDRDSYKVPTPLAQLGDYEADLLKLGYFGWLNLATIGAEVWLQMLGQGVAD